MLNNKNSFHLSVLGGREAVGASRLPTGTGQLVGALGGTQLSELL